MMDFETFTINQTLCTKKSMQEKLNGVQNVCKFRIANIFSFSVTTDKFNEVKKRYEDKNKMMNKKKWYEDFYTIEF